MDERTARKALISAGAKPVRSLGQVTFEPFSSTGSKALRDPQTMKMSLKVSLRLLES
jgi:hypothetical protein